MKLPRPGMVVASIVLVAPVSTGGYAATNLVTGEQGAKGDPGVPSAVGTTTCTVSMGQGDGRKLGLGNASAIRGGHDHVDVPRWSLHHALARSGAA